MAFMTQDHPELKSRLEHGVWIDAIEVSFKAWTAAPSYKKNEHLLHGPTLSWAESWLLTHPQEVPAKLRNYIMRSLSTQTRKSADARAAREEEQQRKDRVYRSLLICMCLFAIVLVGPSAVNNYLGFVDDTPVELAADAENEAAAIPRDDLKKETAASAVVDPPVESTPPQRPAPPRLQRLALAAEVEAARGNLRMAWLLAAEVHSEAHRTSVSPPDQTVVDDALATISGAIAQRTPLNFERNALADGATTRGCGVGGRFVSRAPDGKLRLIEAATSTVRTLLVPPTRSLRAGALDPGCNRLMAVSEDYELSLVPLVPGLAPVRLGTHDTEVVGLGFSRDGRRAISVSNDSVGQVWDTRTGRRLSELRLETGIYVGAALNHDGTRAVTWTDEKEAQIWDTGSGRHLLTLAGHVANITSAAFAPDGRHVFTVSLDGTAQYWSLETKASVSQLRPEIGSLVEAQLAPGGRHAVAITEESTLQIWNHVAGAMLAEIGGTEGKIKDVVFSADGALLAATEWTGVTYIARTSTGEIVSTVNRNGEPVAVVAFSADAKSLVALAAGGTLIRWPVLESPAAVAAEAARLHADAGCWTPEERVRFDLGPALPEWCASFKPSR